MPFVALDKNTEQRIDITRIINPRHALMATDLVCQLCGEPMIVVAGNFRIHHFRHKAECGSEYEAHPESYEHLQTKYFISRNVSQVMDEYSGVSFDLEVKIPEVRRVADILFTFPNGWRIAHEIQLASITRQILEKRTDDYLRAGIDTIWWIGKSADTHSNRLWCAERFGFVLQVEYLPGHGSIDVFTERPLRIKEDAPEGNGLLQRAV